MKTIKILDTTIRDGELSPSFNPSFEARVEIAKHLESSGIDIIEIASTADDLDRLNHSKSIANIIKYSTICCLSQLTVKDLDIADSLLETAEKSRIHLYLDAKRAHQLDKDTEDSEQILDDVSKFIDIAMKRFEEVQFSPQDATRVRLITLNRIIESAVTAGARVINITDTVGTANPDQIREIHSNLTTVFPDIDQIELSLHAHNHEGCAVDNAIAAINAGFTQVEGTINGVGPAGGNTNLVNLAERLDDLSYNRKALISTDLKVLKSLGCLTEIVDSQEI